MLGFPCSSLSGTLFRVTGPLQSLVLRTEDMCQKQLTNIEVAGSQSGFPKKPFSPLMSNRFSVSSMNMLKTIYQRCVMRMKVNTMDVRMRLGDAIDPCHLANGFEAVIGYGCQERSNPPFSHTRRYRQYMQFVTKQVSGWGGVSLSGTLLRVTWMSLWRPMMVPRRD